MKDYRILIPAFVSGACAMVVEIAGGRAIAPYLGTTIYTWSAVIGLVLAALSAGYYAGGKLADRYNDRKHLSSIFMLAAFCTAAIPFLIAVIGPVSVLLDLRIASLLISLPLVPAGFFYGMVSPYAIKLTSEKGREGKSSGSIFALSTVGSIVGVLGTGFLLVPNIALSQIFVLSAALMLACAAAVWGGGVRRMDVLVFLVIALPVSTLAFHPPVSGELLYSSSSEYYEINVFNSTYDGEPALMLYLDSSASSGVSGNGSLAFGYTKKMESAYSLAGSPERALLLGVAGGTQIEDMKSHFPHAQVDGVEIDAEVVSVGERFFGLNDDARTEIIIDDARRFVKTTDRRYGIVLMDTFKGRSVPYHLTSREFVSELKGVMGPGGVLAINIISPLEGGEATLLGMFHNTLSAEFENVVVMPIGSDPYSRQNVVVIATDADVSAFSEEHADDIRPFNPNTGLIITDDLNPSDAFVPIRKVGG